MSYADWHAGMKVVCIAPAEEIAARLGEYAGARFPHHGGVYTIRDMYISNCGNVSLHLLEIDNSHLIGSEFANEPGFRASRFRPLETRQTDISCFTQMLNPSKVNVGEPA